MKFSLIISFLAFIFILAICINEAEGNTYTVDDDVGGGDFQRIQDAVNAADHGDTIEVREGTYHERVTVNKRLHLIGEDRDTTIVTSFSDSDYDYVIRLDADNINISGFNINGSKGKSHLSGALRVNSDGNTITGNTVSGNKYQGIYLTYAHNNTVMDNLCKEASWGSGIGLYYADDNVIVENIFQTNHASGIDLDYALRNTISGNTCTQNGGTGISIEHSEDNTIQDNDCSESGHGIRVRWSSNNVIRDNSLLQIVNEGITLWDSVNIRFYSNEITGGGFQFTGESIEHYSTHIIPPNNTVNGKPFIYLNERSGETISYDTGQIMIVNCSDITVRDQDIRGFSFGIKIYNSEDISIEDCQFSDHDYGIFCEFSENLRIEDVVCLNNEWYGIYLYEVNSSLVASNNYSVNGDNGILLSFSNLNIIERNTCYGNDGEAIMIRNSNSNLIRDNSANENLGSGIKISNSYGNNVEENTCEMNWNHGLYLSNSENTTIEDNTFNVNGMHGVYLDADNNTVSSNILIDNHNDGIRLQGANSIIQDNLCTGNDQGIYLISPGYHTIHPTSDNLLINNLCDTNDNGIYLEYAHHNTLTQNTCTAENEIGIFIEHSQSIMLYSNSLTGEGLFIDGNMAKEFNTHVISINNTVNDKPLYYRVFISDFTYSGQAGQIILFNCTNGIISDQSFGHVRRCIDIRYCSDITISSISINRSGDGIIVTDSTRITISDSTILNFEHDTIYLKNSNHCIIRNNTVSNNPGYALLIQGDNNSVTLNTIEYNNIGVSVKGNNNTISSNTCRSGSICIRLSGARDNIVRENICSNSMNTGIQLQGSTYNLISSNNCDSNARYGIHLDSSHNNDLTGNTCTVNFNTGILLEYSNENLISWCVIDNIFHKGLNLTYSRDNTISYNNIRGNTVGIWIHLGSDGNIFRNNDIHGNTEFGINASFYNGDPIDAMNNWWGDQSGPYQASNPGGSGDNLTDNVEFDPWLEERNNPPPQITVTSVLPNPAMNGQVITFTAHATDDGLIVSYRWTSDIDGLLYFGNLSSVSIGKGPSYHVNMSLSTGNHTVTLQVMDDMGEWSEIVTTSLMIQKDTDGDGIIDDKDAFPNDPAASKDTDGDGYPDEWNPGKTSEDSTSGLKLDVYPDDPDRWNEMDVEEDDDEGSIALFTTLLGLLILIIGILMMMKGKKRKSE